MFDRRRTPTDEFYHLRPVLYLDLHARVRTFVQLAGENVLLTKGLSWASEREWRMLAPLDDVLEIRNSPEGDIHLFEFPAAAVTGVVFGLRAEDGFVEQAVSRVKQQEGWSHVQFRVVRQTRERMELTLQAL